ncbi:MAG: TauD/TfdA family dioxygenase [Arenicellales bacterium]
MPPLPAVKIIEDRRALALNWPDGEFHRYHGIWLRDNGQDSSSRDPYNGQKKFSVADLRIDLDIVNAKVADNRLEIEFSDGTATWLDLEWLKQHHYDRTERPKLINHALISWDGELDTTTVSGSYSLITQSKPALSEWLRWIAVYGFAILKDVPDQPGKLFDVVDLFGFVRETNYGRLFEVRSEANPVNLAFTRDGLDPHTDNPYRDPVPTLQILHCIENDASGGESIVVDGFRCANILDQESPTRFNLLCQHSARFEYRGDGVSSLHACRPIIEVSPEGQLIAVRVNNRSSGPLTGVPYDNVPEFYAAHAHFSKITRRPELAVQFRLAPGELFIVDNTRVLHGRREYSETGSRWFQGAYADKDSLQSTIRMIESHSR